MRTAQRIEISYRKAKSGEWVVCGPVDAIQVGYVSVTKRSGDVVLAHVVSVGRSFDVDGVACRYGYLAPKVPIVSRPAEQRVSSRIESRPCDNCGSGTGRTRRTDSSGIAGMVCGACAHEASYALSFA